MKKNITREQIVEAALELTRHKSELQSLNLREIARGLGCAHTNLYNYFSSYNDLLWETRATLQEIFMLVLMEKLEAVNSAESRLTCFFEAFTDMYMDNKGWFRLAWSEYLGGERPPRYVEAAEIMNEVVNEQILAVCAELEGEYPGDESVTQALRNAYRYVTGELSMCMSGAEEPADEAENKARITREAERIFKLCVGNP